MLRALSPRRAHRAMRLNSPLAILSARISPSMDRSRPALRPAFKGHVSGGTDDFPRLNAWLGANLPQLALPDWPLQSVGLDGAANISQVGGVGSDLTLHVNGSVLTGTLAYTKKIDATPARLFADLSAQRLELPSLPDLSAVAQQMRDMDLGPAFRRTIGQACGFSRRRDRDGANSIRSRKDARRDRAEKACMSAVSMARTSRRTDAGIRKAAIWRFSLTPAVSMKSRRSPRASRQARRPISSPRIAPNSRPLILTSPLKAASIKTR